MSSPRRPSGSVLPRRSRDAGRRRPSTGRRAGRLVLVVAAAASALALAGPFALRPFVDAAGAATEVAVAFVVDLGPSGGEVTGCVRVPASDNRYQALGAFLSQKGLAQPTYAASGLLCSINGIPASGCGETVPGGYIYWAYYVGSGSRWIYSSTGAAAPVGPADVEGWRFQDPGTGHPNDPPPATKPRYAALCPTAPPPTTTTTRPHHGGGGHTTTTRPAATTTTTAKGKATGATTTTTTRPPTVAGINASPLAGSSAGNSSDGSTADTTDTTFPPDPVVKTAPATTVRTGPGLASVALAVLLTLGLGVAALVRWRRRPDAP